MNEFSKRWAALSKSSRRKVKNDMRAKALEGFSTAWKMRATDGSLKAGARIRVDMAIKLAKAAY